jgi:hypothetical protein
MEDDNVDTMRLSEWWETPKTTPRKLRTLEIVFPIIFLVHWHIRDFFLMLQLFSFFWFLDQICTILSMTVDNKGRQDSCQEVCHHAIGDYSFLTQKKKIFLKIISSPPPPTFAPCRESNNAHMDMCNIHMIILILRKLCFLVMTTDHHNLLGMLDQG